MSSVTNKLSEACHSFCTKENAVKAAKFLVVALVVAGIAAASFFTFGAALGAFAVLGGTSIASVSGFMAFSNGLFYSSIGIGLYFSSRYAVKIAKEEGMFDCNKDQNDSDIQQTGRFLGRTLFKTIQITFNSILKTPFRMHSYYHELFPESNRPAATEDNEDNRASAS